MAQFDNVNIYVYGVKSNWQSFAWLDLVHEHNPNADIPMVWFELEFNAPPDTV